MRTLIALLLAALIASPAAAAIHTETVEYKEGDTVLEGYLAYDDAVQGKRPGVVVVHNWTGLDDYEKERARMLAEMGYVAFCADIYGKDAKPKSVQEYGAQAGKYKNDRPLLRKRVNAALDRMKQVPQVDPERTAAIGYCFGGTAVLELARSGAKVGGVVSFHGALDTPTPDEARNIRAKVLVLHGANDPHVPPNDVAAFITEMQSAKVDWDIHAYGGAVHSFTEKEAGNDPSKGAAYNERADRESWKAMQEFFDEIFGKKSAK